MTRSVAPVTARRPRRKGKRSINRVNGLATLAGQIGPHWTLPGTDDGMDNISDHPSEFDGPAPDAAPSQTDVADAIGSDHN